MSGNVIDDYLSDLDRRLIGTRRDRREILTEIGDGLHESVEHFLARGFSLPQARAAAIHEFGAPALLAADFAPVNSSKRINRYGRGFLMIGPLIGILWGTAALLGSFAAVPWPLTVTGLVVMAVAVMIGAPFTAVATAATGRASRWLRMETRLAAKALVVTAVVALTIDAILITTLAAVITLAPQGVVVLPVALATIASLTRIAIAAASIPRLGPARAMTS